MQTIIVKWGNSQGIRIPKTFLKSINISENDSVDVILENEKIIIKKANAKHHKKTKERLLEFYGENFEKNRMPITEIDWGRSLGDESGCMRRTRSAPD
jgi:antitoxin MazE